MEQATTRRRYIFLIALPCINALTFTLVTLPRFNSSFTGNDVEPVLLFMEFGYLCHCPVSVFLFLFALLRFTCCSYFCKK